LLRRIERIDIHLMPPFEFVAALVEFTMVRTTQRHGELVADFAAEGALLRKPKKVRIRRAPTASQAGLGAYELQMVPISKSKLFAKGGDELLSSFGWYVLG
jgi:hypothetical protein